MNQSRSHLSKLRATIAFGLFVLAFILAGVSPAQAKVFKVNSTADKPDTNGGDGKCRASNGKCTLRAAVDQADASPGSDKVLLPGGDFVLKQGQIQIDSGDRLTLSGSGPWGEGSGVLGGGDERVFDIDGDSKVVMRQLYVKGGNSFAGAGIFLDEGSSLTTKRVRIVQNIASYGGSDRRRRRGDLSLPQGGGLYVLGSFTGRATDIVSNRAEGSGGGIFIGPGGLVDIHNSRINANYAEGHGGGIQIVKPFVRRDSSQSRARRSLPITFDLTVIRSSVTSNSAERVSAIHSVGSAVKIYQSTVAENTAAVDFDDPYAALEFFGSYALISNASVVQNSSAYDGFGSGGNLSVDDSYVEVFNSIIADGRISGELRNCYASSGVINSVGFNLSDDDTCSFDEATDIENGNPRLGDLTRNTSRTETVKIFPTSDATNAGPASCGNRDQRFKPRPAGRACDIGAFERQ